MTKINTFLVALFLCANIGFSQTVNWHHHPGNNEGSEDIYDFQIDDQGNSYILARASDTIDVDPSSNTTLFYPFLYNTASTPSLYFLQKIDPSGNVLWTKGWEAISSFGQTSATGLEIMDNQFIYVTGWYQGDLRVDIGPNADTLQTNAFVSSYVFQLDLNGNFITKTNFPPNSDVSVGAMEIDHENNIILSGSITGSPDMTLTSGTPSVITSVGFTDCFTAKYNSSLDLIWVHRFGGNGHEDILDIATDDVGNIITTGTYQSSSNDFDPGAGTASLSYFNSYDGFVHKVDKNGNFKWVKASASNGQASLDRLDIGVNNEIYAVGSYSNNLAVDYPANSNFESSNGSFTKSFVWALDSNGVTSWSKTINGSSSNEIEFVKVNGNELSFGGRVFSSSDANFGSQATPYVMDALTTGYIANYDLSGNLISTNEFKDGYAIISGLEYYNNEKIIAGKWTGTTDFNYGSAVFTETSDSFFDFFVMSVSPFNVSLDEFFTDNSENFIYPNPVEKNELINYSSDFDLVQVYDHLGRMVYSGNELQSIKTAGVYLLRFHSDLGITQRKLVVR